MQKADKELKESSQVKEKVQGRVVSGSGLLHKLNAVHDVASKFDNTKSREEILQVLRSEARWLLTYDVCFVTLLNRAHTHYAFYSLSPIADASELDHKHFLMDEGIPGWVLRNQASFIGEIESAPKFNHAIEGRLQELGIHSILVVPLKTGDELIGTLIFGSLKRKLYTEEDAAISQLTGLYVATSLKDASIFEDARKRINQIELISNISRQMSSTLQFDELLKTAASTVQKTFNYFDVTVFLRAEDSNFVELVAHSGNFVDFLPHNYKQNIEEGLIGWVCRTGETLLCNDVLGESRYLTFEYHNTRSELAVPIKIDKEVVGVFNIEDTKLHAFDETDVVVLETLSDQLGAAMKNAKLYDEIRKGNMKLRELDKMKSEFLGIVSHDFRSPLSSIILAGRALLKNEAVEQAPRVKEYLQIIVDQANRLNQLAEDTLSITKIESGQLNYFFKVVNIERLIQDAISMVRFTARHKVVYNIDPNVAFIKGDQAKLRQVIQNLVSNAVKYSPKGGEVKINVADLSSDQLLISVSDQGIGIPVDQIGKLFQKFSRVEIGQSREIKGAGLGLWICKEIVEAHGGKIWAESPEGEGTTLKFTLNKAQEEISR